MNEFEKFREEVRERISKVAKIKKENIILEKPKDHKFGDIAFPCFTLSKKLRKSPGEIAKDFSSKIKPSGLLAKIEPKGGYLNFFANWDEIGQKTVEGVLKEKENFGKEEKKRGNVMVEYCHFNTHKAVHIGHIRTACLGESLSRILEFYGYKVIRANYQGDIGPHVARCVWGFLKLHEGKKPREERGKWLGTVYAEASKKLKGNEKLSKEVDEVNRKIYAGDPKLTRIWKETRRWSLDYFDKIYESFGIKFNRLYFESEVEKPGTDISKKLLKKRIAKESEGAILMDLEKHGLGVFLLVKSDETPLYSAKDLGLAELKTKEYKIGKSVHVVGSEQKLYFQQLFKTFELMKSPLANKSYHLCYELVNLPTGKMASREGEVILYEDVLNELIKHAKEETEKRNPKMDKKTLESVSKHIALASLKYDMIKMSPTKTIIFDWKKALDFEGNAAPYLQYTYARANSILRKAKVKEIKKFDISLLKAPIERELTKMISEFPEAVQNASNDLHPHYIANYCYNLSTKFNEFYQFMPVIHARLGLKIHRLALVKAVSIVLKNALNLLGIEAPERM
ncbi:MAG: arginine--tRNA ligase [Candidatus Aenigmarchaeota archaeon]|nr:arginine--tRNA ligase [Candidatus Aenigmarchaeota archaeon]NIP40101.1 arginine--tRNA ligase [Candidatus Aenigmarchaeota archaeon]NIQ18178.1 arginine--tRNA ligase [Candidatus Aenigmarchaeota archaeon]NIS72935.1 arginine--tRNA ligase [Candidatus Aenigmarchaeota archaeon]